MNGYTLYDIETSGLSRDSDIYSFSYIRMGDDLSILKTGTLYFYRKGWNIAATEVHGLTQQLLQQHEKDFWKNLATMYAALHGMIAIGKNNMTFDNVVVIKFIERFMYDKDAEKGIRIFNIPQSIDIQNYMKPYYHAYKADAGEYVSGRSSGKLEEYMEMCGFDDNALWEFAVTNNIEIDKERFRAHDGMYDCIMTLATLKWLAYVKKVQFTPR